MFFFSKKTVKRQRKNEKISAWRQICSLLFSIIIWSLFHQAVSLRLRSLVFSLSHLTACTGWAPRQNTAPPTCQNTKLLSKPTRFHTGAGRSLLCSGQNRSFFSLRRELWKHPAPNKQIWRRKTTEAEHKREIWKGNRNKSEMSWESNSSSSRASDSCHVTLLTHTHTHFASILICADPHWHYVITNILTHHLQ